VENKVMIKDGNVDVSISWDGVNEKDIAGMLEIFENLMYAAGYRMNGHLDIVDD